MQGNNNSQKISLGGNRIEIDQGVLRSDPPDAPGVYLFKDASGHVIYVGKAKNLRKRVLSYFRTGPDITAKTAVMMNNARGLDYILTATENEAFLLESTLIKGYMPKYNVILRDDKQYPCLRLDIKEPYPRLSMVRKIRKDGAVYFGPFSSSHSVKSSLRLIERIFRLRKCKTGRLSKRPRPCLNFQMGRCLGPCALDVPSSAYRDIVAQVRLFLEGRSSELLRQLQKEMTRLSDQEDYEEAARIRDQIGALKRTIERQHVVSAHLEDQDVIGLACRENRYQLVINFIRKGYLTGSRNYSFKDITTANTEVMEAFLKQYYSQATFFPKDILISETIDDPDSIAEWISCIAGEKISLIKPLRGAKLKMVEMAVSNAEQALLQTERHQKEDLLELTRSMLNLKKMPERIECLDISNLQGGLAVGTAVSFVNGQPFKAGYRNYRINQIEGINDYGMMAELVTRHLQGGDPPDLLVLDGGKGHLMAADKALEPLNIEEPPEIISIAKADDKKGEKSDKIFLRGRKNPLVLRGDNPVLLMLMRIRDEAHRRAVTYHRKLRSGQMEKSQLDLIPGIGPRKKRQLLKKYSDIKEISMAKPEDIALVKGISMNLAQSISDFFLKERGKKPDKCKIMIDKI
jgi:excinuclease ABC subunit C